MPSEMQAISELDLSAPHLVMLRTESGLSDEVIAARGYRTITNVKELAALNFAPSQCRVPGLLLPLHTTDGGNGLYVYRPDIPRVRQDKHKRNPDGTFKQHVIKYEIPQGAGVRVDCPPVCRPMLADPKIPLWITEGQKKADALASQGQCAIDLLGVWNFKGKNEHGSTTFLADFDYIALEGREVRIVFDSDVMVKPEVRKALDRLTEHLQRKKAHVSVVYLPSAPGSGKVGVDDWLADGHNIEELESLIEAPRPAPQAAPPTVSLLDASPLTLSRPLALLDGRAYAASWLHVKVTTTESLARDGTIIKHDPPLVTTEQRLFVVRDDGYIFGDGGDKPMSDLGMNVHLPEMPPPSKLWSASGIMANRSGQRPKPAEVFQRIVDIINQFIDFDKSLASQITMAMMVACYILATWFLDAFNVIGFLWPNGDRGSGKTHLITIVAELGYLGQVILAGGSYACLRDLADYGATLAFDDAENLADPRRTDPDKRALLLAGNRRGSTVPVKELGPDKTWRTRYVNTFCPRLFSAIQLPDNVLASRTIVVPLVRTADRARANADPADYECWLHKREPLIDDLWALALERLFELPDYEKQVNQRARLTGRNLQPWRAILAVALWLDHHGVPGLWEQMEALSMSYQRERPDIEVSDLTVLLIRGLCERAISAIKTVSAINPPTAWELKTADITDAVKRIAEESEVDIDLEWVTSRRVGRLLGKLRFDKVSRSGGKGGRHWRIALVDLVRYATTYGLPLPDELNALVPNANQSGGSLPVNGSNGTNGTNGTGEAEREEFVL